MVKSHFVIAWGIVALMFCACSPKVDNQRNKVTPRIKYVNMGSSFASGLGVTKISSTSTVRCWRSHDNYSQQLARRLDLELTDVSCHGAKTTDVFEGTPEQAAQIEAIKTDVGLVTINIGGNDLGYIGGLIAASCLTHKISGDAPKVGMCLTPPTAPTEQDYISTEKQMMKVAEEIKQRAPNAILVFVDYATVLPAQGQCETMPMATTAADSARRIAKNLKDITERVAAANKALLMKASDMTSQHHVCATEKWMRGYPDAKWDFETIPYHPTVESMTAIASELEDLLSKYLSRKLE